MEDKSFEQCAETYARNIRETRDKILNDFYIAYAAQLSKFKTIDLQNICVVEQPNVIVNGKICTRYWLDYKPIFDDEE